MLNGFDWQWILYVPAMYIGIFVVLVLLKAIFRSKIKNIENISSVGGGLIPLLTTLCLACVVPILSVFGVLLDFPSIIIALLLGGASYSISDLTAKFLENKGKIFPMHVFILNTTSITLGILILFMFYGGEKEILYPELHIHADFEMYYNKDEIELYKQGNFEKDKFVHFHHEGQNQEDVIHIHKKKGITLLDFLNTLKFNFDLECKSGWIKEGEPTYTYYVNGVPAGQGINEYIIKDLDKLLVTCHGTATDEMINSVRNNACIQSKKC